VSQLAILLALGAMTCFGLAAVLQAVATGRIERRPGLDPRLLLQLARQPVFLASLALNGLGFALHITALQSLPLFLVQAIIAGSVAVTAVLSVRVTGASLARAQWFAVALVVLGLTMLGPSATTGQAAPGGPRAALLLLGALGLVVLAAWFAARVRGAAGAVLLGLLAGTGFGVVAVSARLLPPYGAALLGSPLAYVLPLAGATAFLLYSAAMQRGSVTTTTAALVITQTGVPALVGVLLLGDRVREGFLTLAVAGFVLALGGAVGLGRYERGLAPVG
jgi:drug/metabolite transporter (DMT)-like permease